MEAKGSPAPDTRRRWKPKWDARFDIRVRVEKGLICKLVAADNNFGTAKVSNKSRSENVGFLTKIKSIVSDAAARGDFAGQSELSKGALVVEGVGPFSTVAGMVSPLQLAEKPFYWEPPVFVEGDAVAIAILAASDDLKSRYVSNFDAGTRQGWGETWANDISIRIEAGIQSNMLLDQLVLRVRAGVATNVGGTGGSVGGGCHSRLGGWVGLRSGEVVSIEIHGRKVLVIIRGVVLQGGLNGISSENIVRFRVVLNGLLELFVTSALDRGFISEEGLASK